MAVAGIGGIRMLMGDTDRRRSRRLQLTLPLVYRILSNRGTLHAGTGLTCNLSRKGVLFEADRPLSVGSRLALSIEWPVLLNDTQPIELVLAGSVIRTDQSRAVLQIVHYQFVPRGEATG
jgi:hypothetical protein